MSEMIEAYDSGATTPRVAMGGKAPSPALQPDGQYGSAPLSNKPLQLVIEHPNTPNGNKTPRTSRTPNFMTPLGSPIRRAIKLTKLDPQDAWLPITESRNGNAYYAAFHTLCSGIGIQALVLPVAFTILGWTWGIISLTVAFIWQLYTLGLLVQLHESTENGMRYSRYLQLFNATFGKKIAIVFAMFPIMYLSGGTYVALIIIGGSTSKLLYQIICGGHGCWTKPLTTVEWYLVFTCAAMVLSQIQTCTQLLVSLSLRKLRP